MVGHSPQSCPHRTDGAHLEDMEGLKLYVPAPILEHHHHQLQVLRITDVTCHDSKVVTIKQQLSKKLKRRGRRVGRRECEGGGQWRGNMRSGVVQ